MQDYEKYSLSICLIIFVILTVFFTVLISALVKSTVKLIGYGEQDEDIIKEFAKKKRKKRCKAGCYIGNVILCLFFGGFFAFSLYTNTNATSVSDSFPTFRVVQSTSMATKFEGNTYLTDNDLHDQFDMHDVILTYEMPDEFDLKLYDIVVYEVDGALIVHRIVQIEEPNEKHPDRRHFRLQGDAVQNADRFPVLYEQMRGIYRGEHIPYLGSFITFLKSFAGWLCMALVAFATLITPVLENYLFKKRRERYEALAAGDGVQGRKNRAQTVRREERVPSDQAPPQVWTGRRGDFDIYVVYKPKE